MADDAAGNDAKSDSLTIRVTRAPSDLRLTSIAKLILLEGTQKKWGNGYSYRLDRRPDHQGGDQIHIFGPRGHKWAYRETGDRSEPRKYTLPANEMVCDIVRDVFSLAHGVIIETRVVAVSPNEVIVEATVA